MNRKYVDFFDKMMVYMTWYTYAYKNTFHIRSHSQHKHPLIPYFLWRRYGFIWEDQSKKYNKQSMIWESLSKYHLKWRRYSLSSVWKQSLILEYFWNRNTKKSHIKQLEIWKTNPWDSITLCWQYLCFPRNRCSEWWRCSIYNDENHRWISSNYSTHSAYCSDTQRYE